MKLVKRIFTMVLAVSIMSGMLVGPAYASQIGNDTYSAEQIDGKDLTWENIDGCDILMAVSMNEERYVYEYDAENKRISKNINGVIATFTYDDNGDLISEDRDGLIINYLYENNDVYGEYLFGFVVNGGKYTFVLKDRTVVALLDEDGNIVAQYEYQDGIATVFAPNSAGVMVEQSNESFIGNVNRIRYNSYYFDTETNWYYCGRFYDTVHGRFIDGTDEIGFDDISLYDLTSDVERQSQRLLNQSTYGKSINYSSSWWSGLSTTELVARLIYGENTAYYDDQNAIGRCLLNRYNKKDGQTYASTMDGVCTASGQFAAITGGSNDSNQARNPDTTSSGWKNATYLACAIVLSSYDIDKYISVCGDLDNMGNQTQFLSFSYFMANTRNGSGCIQYNMNGWKNLKDVIIPGVGTYTTKEKLDTAYRNDFVGESNIHFLYK